MTPTLKAKLREELGSLTSDAKLARVYRAVLEGIREPPNEVVMIGAWELSETDDAGKAFTSMIGELLSQGEAVE